jgi:hypothetical protein
MIEGSAPIAEEMTKVYRIDARASEIGESRQATKPPSERDLASPHLASSRLGGPLSRLRPSVGLGARAVVGRHGGRIGRLAAADRIDAADPVIETARGAWIATVIREAHQVFQANGHIALVLGQAVRAACRDALQVASSVAHTCLGGCFGLRHALTGIGMRIACFIAHKSARIHPGRRAIGSKVCVVSAPAPRRVGPPNGPVHRRQAS